MNDASTRTSRSARATGWMGALSALALAGCSGPVNNQQGYMPEQPVAFSHAVHAGQYELDCQYCHVGAEKSRHAGVPSSSVCMNCHTQVKKDSPEIQKVAASVAENKPLEWVRVHRLPDHAYFNHASHVTSGLKCQTCHGPVQEMVRLEQVEPMTMGWCLDCHRETAAAQVSALPPSAPRSGELLAMSTGAPPPAPLKEPRILQPPTDCSSCHR
ncbi:cytochrome c3 family protein [Pyxidicoccus fallax]|uniref:Cytochrome c3 family protein n=1 Tax=Pyxidicoccus fallax TaxID=394095 RepID=A0A848LT15_9BACT|nr:cytochrome c3 family protein [Pyxidicoccus fallax]NMO20643.1 cytochrome c3 family protein [Pyxidicoccus fallax]NPC81415.1 cytochrome c3 family protein [Pyxidicoccus fallax]